MDYDEDMMEKKKLAKKYIEKLGKLRSERSTLESHWQEIMDYIIPRKRDIQSTLTPGDKRNTDLFDSTAIMANQLLAAALHSMLTNPATRFFELIMGDPELDDDDEVKRWLQESAERMFIVMNNSNFQTEIHEIYIDLCATGTSCLYMGEHSTNVVHFGARSLKEIFIEENNLGIIDTVYREFMWTPKQVVQEFGEANVSEFVLRTYESGSDEKWKIIHVVHEIPTNERKQFRFKSCYVLEDNEEILSEGGFHEFPYAVPRWTKTTGEVYGRGPGMDMLPDIKMVNEMMRSTIEGAQKMINPPLAVEDDGVIGRVRLTPGGLTVVRPGAAPIVPLIKDSRIDFGYQAVEDVRKRIRSGFYVDQLQLNEGPQMTAAEVMQRTEEKLRLMGPVLGRQHFEFLRPVIERVFGIMVRRELIQEPPQQIKGKTFDVRYSSLVARAQQASDGQMLGRAIGVAAPIIQALPKALDNLDEDAAFKYIMSIYGIPEKILRTKRDVEGIRDARAQAQQQAIQQQQEAHQAEVANKVMPGAAQMMQAQAKQGG